MIGETFPYGLINSKTSKLVEGEEFYFVGDFWTTTRYPKTSEGLISAQEHITDNLRMDNEIKTGCLE